MPRISSINGVEAPGLSDAIEMVAGDTRTMNAVWVAGDPEAPVDLTGATIEVICEPYEATVSLTGGRGGDYSISMSGMRRPMVLDANDNPVPEYATRRIDAVIADQTVADNLGKFVWIAPADLAPWNPELDATELPVMFTMYRRTIGATVETARQVIYWRRGEL